MGENTMSIVITNQRNAVYANADHTIVDLEVYEESLGWMPISVSLSGTIQDHLAGVISWLTNNPELISDYVIDLEEEKQNLKEKITEERYRRETGGMKFNGVPISTSHDAQAKMTGVAFQAYIDNTLIVTWKTDIGPIQLDAATIIAIAQAVRVHVQSCYDREFVLHAAVDDGTYTEDMLQTGWPTY